MGSLSHYLALKFAVLISIKRPILVLFAIYLIIGAVLSLFLNKYDLHLMLNSFHHPILDGFFKYITYLGNGIFYLLLFSLFIFLDKRISIAALVTSLLCLVVVWLFKHVLFQGTMRPLGYFGTETLHTVHGVPKHFWNTFPSGHAITAFSLATLLCFHNRRSAVQYGWFTLAVVASYSRVYLSHHFLIDIIVGSIIGVIIGLAGHWLAGYLYKEVLKYHGRKSSTG